MNIILGKLGGIGTSFLDGYKEYGGDLIAKMFIDFAKRHPENKYFLASTNDMDKAFTGFNAAKQPSNLINYYKRQKQWLADHGVKPQQGDAYRMLEASLEEDNIKIDKIAKKSNIFFI